MDDFPESKGKVLTWVRSAVVTGDPVVLSAESQEDRALKPTTAARITVGIISTSNRFTSFFSDSSLSFCIYTDPDVAPNVHSTATFSVSHCFQPSLVHLFTALFCFYLLLLCSCRTLLLLLSPCLKVSFFFLSVFLLSAASSWAFLSKHIPPTSILCANKAVLLTQLCSPLHKHWTKHSFSCLRLHFF